MIVIIIITFPHLKHLSFFLQKCLERKVGCKVFWLKKYLMLNCNPRNNIYLRWIVSKITKRVQSCIYKRWYGRKNASPSILIMYDQVTQRQRVTHSRWRPVGLAHGAVCGNLRPDDDWLKSILLLLFFLRVYLINSTKSSTAN